MESREEVRRESQKEKGREEQVREVRRRKIQVHEKVRKSRNTVFFSYVLWLPWVEK